MGGIIRRNDLDRLMGWLLNVIGPGVGDVFFVASASSAYETWFKKIGVDSSHLFATVALAYAAMTTNRNDTVLMAPEGIAATAELDWTKNNCNLIGLGGPNVQGRKGPSGTFPTMYGGSCLYSTTSGLVHLLHVTGARNRFYNMHFVNAVNEATALSAVKVGGSLNLSYGNYFKNCNIQGIAGTTCNTTDNCSLKISAGASYYLFEDCIIGNHTYMGARATANQGHLHYPGVYETGSPGAAGYGPQDGRFVRCDFKSRGTTLTPVMVRVEPGGNEALDRIHQFVDCSFINWSGSDAAIVRVFYDACGTWHGIVLRRCTAVGYDEWQTDDLGTHPGYISADMPITGVAGGHARMPTGAHDSGT